MNLSLAVCHFLFIQYEYHIICIKYIFHSIINYGLRKAVSYFGLGLVQPIINPFVFQVLVAAFQIASRFEALATLANVLSRDD